MKCKKMIALLLLITSVLMLTAGCNRTYDYSFAQNLDNVEIIGFDNFYASSIETVKDCIDDERFDLECFVGGRLVQTSSTRKGQMIKGHWYENTGLKWKHVKKAIFILSVEY